MVKEVQNSTTGKGFTCRYQSFKKKAIAELEEVTLLILISGVKNVLLPCHQGTPFVLEFGFFEDSEECQWLGIQDNITERFKMYHMMGLLGSFLDDVLYPGRSDLLGAAGCNGTLLQLLWEWLAIPGEACLSRVVFVSSKMAIPSPIFILGDDEVVKKGGDLCTVL